MLTSVADSSSREKETPHKHKAQMEQIESKSVGANCLRPSGIEKDACSSEKEYIDANTT